MSDAARWVRPSIREETLQRVWCKHFNGLMNSRCAVGMAYDTVRVERHEGAFQYRYACFRRDEVPHLCPHVLYPTDAEIEQAAQETEAAIQDGLRFMDDYMLAVKAGICPHCGQPMTEVKRGWSIYAVPCGHRLGTGKPG